MQQIVLVVLKWGCPDTEIKVWRNKDMPLLKCPDCGNMVSDKAAFCMKCGCPIDCIVSENKKYITHGEIAPQEPLEIGKIISNNIEKGTELWHEKYGMGIVVGFEESQSGEIIVVSFTDDKRRFLYPSSIGTHLFTLETIPKSSRYYKEEKDRIEKKKKEELLSRRNNRLKSRNSAFLSCEDEIEKAEAKQISKLTNQSKSDVITVGEPDEGSEREDFNELAEQMESHDDEKSVIDDSDEAYDSSYEDEEIEREYRDVEDELMSERMDYADSMDRLNEDGWFYEDEDDTSVDDIICGGSDDSECYGFDDDPYDVSDEEINFGKDDEDF